MATLGQQMEEVNVSINGEVTLLYVENEQMTCRGIGMIDSSLALQDIEIVMQRYFKSRDRFVIGVPAQEADRAVQIITGIIDAGYRI